MTFPDIRVGVGLTIILAGRSYLASAAPQHIVYAEEGMATGTAAGQREQNEQEFPDAARTLASSLDPQGELSEAAQEAMRSVAASCASQIGAAREALATRDHVLGVVAHDLRSPLNTIVTSADLLLHLPLSEEQRARQLDVILRSAMRMDRLIQDLLDVARLEAAPLRLELQFLPAAAVARDAVEMHATRAAAASQEISFTADPDLPLIRGDRHRLLQALSNLLDNALRYTPRGGCIDVRCTRTDGGVCYTVADDGPGVASEDLPNLFADFWQGRHPSHGGTGLGLTIARGVVEAHGGSITAANRPEGGAVFAITIPVAGTRRES